MERHRPHIVTSFTRPRLSLSHLCTFSSRLDHALTPAVIGPLARLPTTGQQASSRRRHIRLTRVPRCTYLLTGRPMLASLLARSSWHFDMGIGSAVPMYVFGPDMSALVCESQLASRADHTDHVIVVVLYRVDMPIRSWELITLYIHTAPSRGTGLLSTRAQPSETGDLSPIRSRDAPQPFCATKGRHLEPVSHFRILPHPSP